VQQANNVRSKANMTLIPCQRHLFTMPRDVHYLNCAYMSPISLAVRDAVAAGATRKEQPWAYKPADFFSYSEAFRGQAAKVMGADANCIAIVPSVSYALAIAARNIAISAGQSIILLGDQFPSNVYVWRQRAHDTGAKIVTVQRDPDTDWTGAVLDAITPDTAVVAVPHCHWADGRLVDLVAVGAACRAVGAALVLDLTQSLGALPINIAEVQPDFAVAACYKWLMGPYTMGMTYVAPRYHEGQPLEHNWINRAGAEDFARLVDYRDDFLPGARRYDMGEKSNPALLSGASAGIDMLLGWGIGSICETLEVKTEALAEAARHIGLTAAPVGVRAPHFLSLAFPGKVPSGLMDALAAKNVHVSLRGTSLRVTPHLYNDDQDAERLIEVLEAL
jgi:selenocysteine lyase/cysteine desulfurase